jgi:hypothetical protein
MAQGVEAEAQPKEPADPVTLARRMAAAAHRLAQAALEKLEEEGDAWDEELGVGPKLWNDAGEDGPR